EAAVKLARKYAADNGAGPEAREIITFEGSFHGRTIAMVTATSQPKYQKGFEPLPGGFTYVPFNDFDAISKAVSDKTCAIMVEPVQGEGGIMPAAPGFLKHLRELCDKHDALLIYDEVQCGMGRTGKLFAHQHEEGAEPDIMTLAKALGCGVPIGATLVGKKAEQTFQFGSHGSTYGGNPMMCAVAYTALQKINSPAVMQNVARQSEALMSGLRKIGDDLGLFKEVRGRGLMIGAELNEPWHGKAGAISETCRQHGLLTLVAGPNVMRLVPPLNITDEEVAAGLSRMTEALASFAQEQAA
ncbi:MAG: aspartate aminotransferase family protein, partial [Rickettsiales bacterium]